MEEAYTMRSAHDAPGLFSLMVERQPMACLSPALPPWLLSGHMRIVPPLEPPSLVAFP